MAMSTTIKLRHPIMAHGVEIHELTLREPTAGDVMESGYPIALKGDLVFPQPDPLGRLIARLADIPPSSVKQLTMADYNAAMGAVLGFFGAPDDPAAT